MMYEIYYEPKGGVWRIRITTIYLFFIEVSRVASQWVKDEGAARHLEPLDFDTFEEALTHATAIGLNRAYKLRKRSEGYTTWVAAEGCHAPSS